MPHGDVKAMTQKTVQQVVDEYLNRYKRNNLFYVMFLNDGRRDGYLRVTNIYRDGVKIDAPIRDEDYHIYEFDSGFQPTMLKPDLEWTHYTMRGKIIEHSHKIED